MIKLMDIDLLKHFETWKKGVKGIRQIISNVETMGFPEVTAWKVHWDRQLYKCLEYQYQVGLEDLNNHLPVMEVSIIYR